MKTILVTGAAGFVGSHLVEALLSRGDRVVGLDNLDEYYDRERKQANLAEAAGADPSGGRFSFVRGDVRDAGLINRLFEENQFHSVVHLAALAGVRASIERPQNYFDVNVRGTLNLLEEVKTLPSTTFVMASTSSAYGRTARVPFEESDAADRPLAPYAASKRAAEMLGFTYHSLYGLNFVALRFFTVYGPRGRPDMMPYKVAESIATGRQIPLYNEGKLYRDWTFISDVVGGVLAAVDRPLGYEVINLGRGEPVLLRDFIHQLEQTAGRPANLVPAPIPASDMDLTSADIAKARRLLGYDPHVSVSEGTSLFWAWYQQAVLGRVVSPTSSVPRRS